MNRPRRFGVFDFLIIAVVALLAGFLLFSLTRTPAAEVNITAGGKPYGHWRLPSTPETLSIEGRLRVEIGPEGARVIDSDCPRGLCRHQGLLNRSGQSLICVPNRICIRLGQGDQLDAEAQ